jgi:1-deoxy-D-xylulose-5-phosphate reductoisomerase
MRYVGATPPGDGPRQAAWPAPRRVSVLGSTGSIGKSTLDLIGRNSDSYQVVALTGRSNVGCLAEQAIAHRAELAVIGDASLYGELKERLSGTGIEAAAGEAAVIEAASRPAGWVMAAIVGAAGLRPTLAAVRQGTTVALATKECLVCAGQLFMAEVAKAKATLLPVDSEHSAAFQAIDNAPCDGVESITLTASGGPFRTWSEAQLDTVTPEQALKHPNWSMGPKITVDSATLMNKGLEVIEAFHLFPVSADQLDVVIHPQSIVHCLVQYCDGSVLAQLSVPDMRTPIAYSLAWPQRMDSPVKRLNLAEIGALTFEAPDEKRFPALRIAREAMKAGGLATAQLNAANEVAVEAFLAGRLSFKGIPALVEATLAACTGTFPGHNHTLDDVFEADAVARRTALSLCKGLSEKFAAA